jgi:hypothetical protein
VNHIGADFSGTSTRAEVEVHYATGKVVGSFLVSIRKSLAASIDFGNDRGEMSFDRVEGAIREVEVRIDSSHRNTI